MWTAFVLVLLIVLPIAVVIFSAIYHVACEGRILERASTNFEGFTDPERHRRTIRAVVRYDDDKEQFLIDTQDDADFLFYVSTYEATPILRMRRLWKIYSFFVTKYLLVVVAILGWFLYQAIRQ